MAAPLFLRSASLRTRLTLVAVISLILGAGLTLARGWAIGREGQVRVRGDMLRLADLANNDISLSVLHARRLFVSLASNPSLLDRAACRRVLADVARHGADLRELGVVSGDGTILCDSDSTRAGMSVASEPWFRRLTAGQAFVLGRTSGARGATEVMLGAPLDAVRGSGARFVIGALDLGTIVRRAAESTGIPDAAATLSDADLVVLTRFPGAEQYAGRPALRDSSVLRALKEGRGVVERSGFDSVVRIYAIEAVEAGLPAPLVLSLGVPREAALAEVARHRRETVLSFGAALGILLVGVWIASDLLLTRPTRALVVAANRLAAGDLQARSGAETAGGEIGELGRALDSLARSLEARRVGLDAALAQARDAEATARENEARYRKLFELAPAPAVVWDQANRAVITNQAMAETFGYGSPAELIGLHADAFVAPEDQQALAERRIEAARDGVARPINWTGIRKDGTRFPMESSSITLRDGNGSPIGRLAIGYDLSTRRELELRRHELGRLIEESTNEVYLLDPDSHRVLGASRGARENLGYSAEALQSLRVSDISPPELAAATLRRLETLRTGSVNRLEYECELVRKNGSRYPVHLTIQHATFEGRPALLAFAVDITERLERDRELTRSEAKYRSLVEGSADLILRLDRNGRVEFLNGAAREFGAVRGEVLEGRRMDEFRWFAGSRAWLGTALETVFRTGDRAETNVDLPGGLCYNGRLFAERDPEGSVRNVIFVLHDITARRRAELELERSLGELRALSTRLDSVREEERADIAREIHDELGQALTGLKMDTVWLERRVGPPDGLAAVRLARMRQLIDETVHTVRRLATELRPPILDDLGLGATVQWQVEQFASRTGIPADVAAPEGVSGSPEINLTLFRVLQEALTNIVRHAEARRVRVGLVRHGGELVLTVADDGRGFTARDVRSGALGLVGMRERISRVRGVLEVTSARGEGTTITARVPG